MAHTYYYALNHDKIISEILKSYGNPNILIDTVSKQNILKQFEIDFHRSCILVNNNKMDSTNNFKNEIIKYYDYYHGVMYRTYYLIIMLCTQSVFYYPFFILFKMFTNSEKHMHILPAADPPKIKIDTSDNKIYIVAEKNFIYYNIDTGITHSNFFTKFTITIELNSRYLNAKIINMWILINNIYTNRQMQCVNN